MSNILNAFNVKNNKELIEFIDSLDLNYSQESELYSSLNENMSAEGIRFIIESLFKEYDNGSYEILKEQYNKKSFKRTLKENSSYSKWARIINRFENAILSDYPTVESIDNIRHRNNNEEQYSNIFWYSYVTLYELYKEYFTNATEPLQEIQTEIIRCADEDVTTDMLGEFSDSDEYVNSSDGGYINLYEMLSHYSKEEICRNAYIKTKDIVEKFNENFSRLHNLLEYQEMLRNILTKYKLYDKESIYKNIDNERCIIDIIDFFNMLPSSYNGSRYSSDIYELIISTLGATPSEQRNRWIRDYDYSNIEELVDNEGLDDILSLLRGTSDLNRIAFYAKTKLLDLLDKNKDLLEKLVDIKPPEEDGSDMLESLYSSNDDDIRNEIKELELYLYRNHEYEIRDIEDEEYIEDAESTRNFLMDKFNAMADKFESLCDKGLDIAKIFKLKLENKLNEMGHQYVDEEDINNFTDYASVEDFIITCLSGGDYSTLFYWMTLDAECEILLYFIDGLKKICNEYNENEDNSIFKKPKDNGFDDWEIDESTKQLNESDHPLIKIDSLMAQLDDIEKDYSNDTRNGYYDNFFNHYYTIIYSLKINLYDDAIKIIDDINEELKKDYKTHFNNSNITNEMDMYISLPVKDKMNLNKKLYESIKEMCSNYDNRDPNEIIGVIKKTNSSGNEFMESYDVNQEPLLDIGDNVSFKWNDEPKTGRIISVNKIGSNEYFDVISYNTKTNKRETYVRLCPVSNEMKKIGEE